MLQQGTVRVQLGYTWVHLGIGRGEMRVTQPNRGANAQAVPQQCTFKSDYNVYISSASRNNAHWTNCSTFHRLQASCAKSQLRGGGERSDEDQGLLQMKISLSTITLCLLTSFIWFAQYHMVWSNKKKPMWQHCIWMLWNLIFQLVISLPATYFDLCQIYLL